MHRFKARSRALFAHIRSVGVLLTATIAASAQTASPASPAEADRESVIDAAENAARRGAWDDAMRLLEPLLGGYRIMPVISSGQWGGQAPETYRQVPTVDLMYLAGGGMIAHPGGPAAGCRAIRQAWEAAVAGVTLEEYAREHTELRQSLETFGSRSQSG